MTKFTEEQIKYLEEVIVFTENGMSVKDFKGNVWGDVEGSVLGDVWGDVWGDVKGYVGGHVRGDVKHTCQQG
jgi:hypothetical protein